MFFVGQLANVPFLEDGALTPKAELYSFYFWILQIIHIPLEASSSVNPGKL